MDMIFTRAWLTRFKEWCVASNITNQRQMAAIILRPLHGGDVRAPRRENNYPRDVCENLTASATILTITYGNQKTPDQHGTVYRSVERGDKESAVDFFQRLFT